MTGEDEPAVLDTTLKLNARLRALMLGDYRDCPAYIFGPMEAPVYKVNNVYRMRILLKCAATKRMRELIRQLLEEFSKVKASVGADVNPNSV